MLKIGSRREIIEKSREQNQIVAFGAGKRLKKLAEYFNDTEAWNKINYVIDNDEKKQNTEIIIGGKSLKIISLNELKNMNLNNYVIIITCAKYDDILKQEDVTYGRKGIIERISENIDFAEQYCDDYLNCMLKENKKIVYN